jgi:predicted nucleic-acid-binding protein
MSRRAFADTNLFLRYVTNDVPKQADAVEKLFQQAASGEVQLYTNAMVMAEIVWTLESFYNLERPAIKDILLGIVNTPGLEVETADLVIQAVVWFEEKNVDFIDAYNAAWMAEHELVEIYSFDRKHFKRFEQLALKVPGV